MTNYNIIDAAQIESSVDIYDLIKMLKSVYKKNLRQYTITPDRIAVVKDEPFSAYVVAPSINEKLGVFVTKTATLLQFWDVTKKINFLQSLHLRFENTTYKSQI